MVVKLTLISLNPNTRTESRKRNKWNISNNVLFNKKNKNKISKVDIVKITSKENKIEMLINVSFNTE